MNETAKGQWNKKLKGSVETKVLVILTVCVVIVFVFFATRPKDSFFERLGVQIGAASGIYIAIGVFITWKFLEYNHEAVDRVWLNFHKLMNEHRGTSPNLISQLFFPWQRDGYTTKLDTSRPDDWYTNIIISNAIFQMWEDVLTLSSCSILGRPFSRTCGSNSSPTTR